MQEVQELERDPRVFKVQGQMCFWVTGGAKVAQAARYPPELARGILRALKKQLQMDGDAMAADAHSGPVAEQATDWDAVAFSSQGERQRRALLG